jgi:hypothetical protein
MRLALEGLSRMVESIFSVQLSTPFHHHYFRQEKHAPLRLCETWPRLNSCSRSMQSKGTPMGAYLTHPSIKVKAKAGKQVHDSFSKLVTLTYLLVLSSSSGAPPRTPSYRSHPIADRAMKRPMEVSPEVVPACAHIREMLRRDGGQLDDAATREPIPASGYLLRRRGVDP